MKYGTNTAVQFVCEFLELRHIPRDRLIDITNGNVVESERFTELFRLSAEWESAWRVRKDTADAVERQRIQATGAMFIEFTRRLERCDDHLAELHASFVAEFERVFGQQP